QVAERFLRRDVGLDSERLAGSGVAALPRIDCIRHRPAGVELARRDDDVGTLFGEALRRCTADAAGRPGDDRDAAGEIKERHRAYILHALTPGKSLGNPISMPTLHVLLKKEDLDPALIAGRVVIVLDILFATSTMVTALAQGVEAVWPALNGDDANV